MHVFLLAGIVVSLILAEISGFSPGGVVVAGYLAMFFLQPAWLIGTLLAALATYALVKLVENRLLLYGRRLFAVYVLTGIVVSQAAAWLWRIQDVSDAGLLIIGYLIPGLLARDFSRQGVANTIIWSSIAVVLTRILVLAGEGFVW